MIVATAGHIDHGKTRLVQALTGIDTDRLPEEKRRGMSIDLGFAYQTLPGGEVLGFVDVPGHERFIANMLAGVAAIDYALLVVAADDGPMPQTHEHLAVLDLLGVARGAVALTKIDRADERRCAAVAAETAALLRGTSLAGAPIFPVSALEGQGLEALRGALEEAARELPRRSAEGRFRLAVDRCFVLPGAGLIATGAALSGRVAAGDELLLSPEGSPVRVRGLHAQNRSAETGRAGERIALNLAGPGLAKEKIRRGDWLLAPALHAPTARFDARLRLLPGEGSALRQRTPVHLHLGAADLTARVVPLEGPALAPGESAWARLVLDRPVSALFGDRFVLRDQAARRTIGGGSVIDPFAPQRGRAKPGRLARLAALERPDPAQSLRALLALASEGVSLARFGIARNLADERLKAVVQESGAVTRGGDAAPLAFAPDHWRGLKERLLAALQEAHRAHPERPGESAGALARSLPARLDSAVLDDLVGELAAEGRLERSGGLLYLPGHRATMPGADAALWRSVGPLLAASPARPPAAPEIAKALGRETREVERCLVAAARHGLAVRVGRHRFFAPEGVRRLACAAEALAAASPGGLFSAAAFRDRAAIGRNLAIEVLEYFDRTGFTRRDGERRRVLKPAARTFGGAGT